MGFKYAAALLSIVQARYYTTHKAGPVFEVTYSEQLSKFRFDLTLPESSEIELIFGPDINKDADIVRFVAKGKGRVEDLYGSAVSIRKDVIQNYGEDA